MVDLPTAGHKVLDAAIAEKVLGLRDLKIIAWQLQSQKHAARSARCTLRQGYCC